MSSTRKRREGVIGHLVVAAEPSALLASRGQWGYVRPPARSVAAAAAVGLKGACPATFPFNNGERTCPATVRSTTASPISRRCPIIVRSTRAGRSASWRSSSSIAHLGPSVPPIESSIPGILRGSCWSSRSASRQASWMARQTSSRINGIRRFALPLPCAR